MVTSRKIMDFENIRINNTIIKDNICLPLLLVIYYALRTIHVLYAAGKSKPVNMTCLHAVPVRRFFDKK
jgi:hypothetical protein